MTQPGMPASLARIPCCGSGFTGCEACESSHVSPVGLVNWKASEPRKNALLSHFVGQWRFQWMGRTTHLPRWVVGEECQKNPHDPRRRKCLSFGGSLCSFFGGLKRQILPCKCKGRQRKPLAEVFSSAPRCAPLRLFANLLRGLSMRKPYFSMHQIKKPNKKAAHWQGG